MAYYYQTLVNWLENVSHNGWTWIGSMGRDQWLIAMVIGAGLGLLCMRGMNRQSSP